MTASELQARLTASRAALGDYQRWARGEAVTGDWQSWAFRLAAELASVCTALHGALTMLDDADQVLADQDASGVIVTGGLSVSREDAPVVMAALADAAQCAEEEHIPSSPSDEQPARYRELAARLADDTDPPDPSEEAEAVPGEHIESIAFGGDE